MSTSISAQDFITHLKDPTFNRSFNIDDDLDVTLGKSESWTSASSWIGWGIEKALGASEASASKEAQATRFADLLKSEAKTLKGLSVADLTHCIDQTKALKGRLQTSNTTTNNSINAALKGALDRLKKSKEKRLGDIPPSLLGRVYNSLKSNAITLAKSDWRAQMALLGFVATTYSYPGATFKAAGATAGYCLNAGFSLLNGVASFAVNNPAFALGSLTAGVIAYKAPMSGKKKTALAVGAGLFAFGAFQAPETTWAFTTQLTSALAMTVGGLGSATKKLFDLGPLGPLLVAGGAVYVHQNQDWAKGVAARLFARSMNNRVSCGVQRVATGIANSASRLESNVAQACKPVTKFIHRVARKTAQLGGFDRSSPSTSGGFKILPYS